MNIQSEIRDYILSHDFVMLPGIGSFLAEYSRPYFDAHGDIVESKREIRFNPHLRNDSDVEILQVFRARMGVSNEEIQRKYFDFLDIVDESLSRQNRYYWEGFGILAREPGSRETRFIPIQKEETTSVEKPVVTSEEIARIVRKEVSEFSQKSFNRGDVPELVTGYHYRKDKKKDPVFFKYLIFALPLLLLAGALVYTVFFKPIATNSVKEEAKASTQLFPEQNFSVDTLEEYTEEPAVEIEDVPAKEYIVGIGIYKNTKDADRIATFLAENGYPSRIRPHGPLFKVYLVAASEDQAKEYVHEVGQLIDDTPVYEKQK